MRGPEPSIVRPIGRMAPKRGAIVHVRPLRFRFLLSPVLVPKPGQRSEELLQSQSPLLAPFVWMMQTESRVAWRTLRRMV